LISIGSPSGAVRTNATRVPGLTPISRSRRNADPVFGNSWTTAEAPTDSAERAIGEAIGGSGPPQLFNENAFGGIVTQRDAVAVHLTQNRGMTGNFGN